MPARKNSSWVTSTAATRLPTSPAIEMALGVSRDSISRLRAARAHLGRGQAALPRRWLIYVGHYASRRRVRHAQASGRARASA